MPNPLLLKRRALLSLLAPAIVLLTSLSAHAQLDVPELVKYPGQIVLDTRGIFTLSGSDPEALAERTALVQARLNKTLSTDSPEVKAVKVTGNGSSWQVLLGGQLLATVTAADMARHNSTARALAEEWAASLREVLKDDKALATHREFNSSPDWVSYNDLSYLRTDRTRTETSSFRSSGYIFKRNLIFLDSRRKRPEQVYLRDADGSYTIYERLRDPQSPPRAR
ncbi:hypothetical protein [Gloeobacter kilaueensis]|uniref:Uncharacterized protein n=1 Tax=Gloeobacter kilaueensis (strain ATCC BAA-2537 / CCAP 1431/1 / ULC 316 / JS1) TaxID=1183438 RepID=U5QLG2_GLOK1|nr:hypothetical protein [Gloeobacter kilaueensis]AGY58434.1 hypothetical protein GKIL_2188 [Gloeobacter kilaueensis JS1]